MRRSSREADEDGTELVFQGVSVLTSLYLSKISKGVRPIVTSQISQEQSKAINVLARFNGVLEGVAPFSQCGKSAPRKPAQPHRPPPTRRGDQNPPHNEVIQYVPSEPEDNEPAESQSQEEDSDTDVASSSSDDRDLLPVYDPRNHRWVLCTREQRENAIQQGAETGAPPLSILVPPAPTREVVSAADRVLRCGCNFPAAKVNGRYVCAQQHPYRVCCFSLSMRQVPTLMSTSQVVHLRRSGLCTEHRAIFRELDTCLTRLEGISTEQSSDVLQMDVRVTLSNCALDSVGCVLRHCPVRGRLLGSSEQYWYERALEVRHMTQPEREELLLHGESWRCWSNAQRLQAMLAEPDSVWELQAFHCDDEDCTENVPVGNRCSRQHCECACHQLSCDV